MKNPCWNHLPMDWARVALIAGVVVLAIVKLVSCVTAQEARGRAEINRNLEWPDKFIPQTP